MAFTSMSEMIRIRIEEMSPHRSQRQIAEDVGYPKVNIVSMHKRGVAKVPINKVPDYARVLDVDVAEVFRLWLQQYAITPETARMIAMHALTPRERQWLDLIRKMEAA